VDLYGTLGECLFQRERDGAARRFAVHEVDREIFVNDRPGDAVVVRARRTKCEDRQRRSRQRNQCSAMHGRVPPTTPLERSVTFLYGRV